MSYYENSRPWPAVGQNTWNDLDLDGQTVRSGSSSTVPSQGPPPPPPNTDSAAFTHQFEEVDRAIDNLVKSGKMFGMPGRHGRQGHGVTARPHSMAEFGDARGAHQSNLQNFYASQRHQSSRGSNEAEQMIQVKRRMAAQRERELRNYHQEQQYNRTVLADITPDRTLSPGGMSDADRRDLIARQRSALYGEGPFRESGGYVDETGTPRPGVPGLHHGPAAVFRGHSPLAYELGRAPPTDGPSPQDGGMAAASPVGVAGVNPPSRANSSGSQQQQQLQADLQAAAAAAAAAAQGQGQGQGQGQTQPPSQQQQQHTSNGSSPGGVSPSNDKPTGAGGLGGSSSTGAAVAPIGTRAPIHPPTPAGATTGNRSTTPRSAAASGPADTTDNGAGGGGGGGGSSTTAGTSGPTSASTPSSATPDGSASAMGVPGWGSRGGGSVWGNSSKPGGGMGVQASIWG